MCDLDSEQIKNQILLYLTQHTEAQDTFEGICEWWLLEQQINFQVKNVKEAITYLTKQKLLLQKKSPDARTYYRINRHKLKKIRAMLEEETH